MKKIIALLLGIIVVSNGIWSYLYFSKVEESNAVVQYYNLSGTGEAWDVTDYKIIVSPNKILRGHGKLVYKGDPKGIENSTYYNFEMKERGLDGKTTAVYSAESSSKNGPVSILTNLDNMGSITGEYSYDERKKDKQHYESTAVTVTWNDNNGELHTETIDLDIDSEIVLQ